MLTKLKNLVSHVRKQQGLRALNAYRHPEDSDELAIKLAYQRSLGTKIGGRCRLMGRVDSLNPHLIQIGERSVIGTESILLAHGPGFDGKRMTIVGDYTYIGYRVTVLPGVRIGSNCIIGAGAVVTSDIPDAAVAAGIPARVLRSVTLDETADIRYRMDNDLHFDGRPISK